MSLQLQHNGGDLAITDALEPAATNGGANGNSNGLLAGEEDETFMFDTSLLHKLDFSGLQCFKPPISPAEPGPGLKVRALSSADYDRGKNYFVVVRIFTACMSHIKRTGKVGVEKQQPVFR